MLQNYNDSSAAVPPLGPEVDAPAPGAFFDPAFDTLY